MKSGLKLMALLPIVTISSFLIASDALSVSGLTRASEEQERLEKEFVESGKKLEEEERRLQEAYKTRCRWVANFLISSVSVKNGVRDTGIARRAITEWGRCQRYYSDTCVRIGRGKKGDFYRLTHDLSVNLAEVEAAIKVLEVEDEMNSWRYTCSHQSGFYPVEACDESSFVKRQQRIDSAREEFSWRGKCSAANGNVE